MIDLTIFTAPKPFVDAHIITIQRNAIRSWKQMGERVEVILVGDEPGIAEAARDLQVQHIPQVQRNRAGTPLISSIFAVARARSQAGLLAYVNADILLMHDFLEGALAVASQKEKFLIAGQRWDLDIREELFFQEGWEAGLRKHISENGELHVPWGSDYFIYPRACYQEMPDFAVGRAGWDNWMLFQARWMKWPLVNATGAIDIVHQQHDYSHLPNAQPHYRLPESSENVLLAGGRKAIFQLRDADHALVGGTVRRMGMSFARLVREIEIFPLVSLHSHALGELFYAIFHPRKTYGALRKRLGTRSGSAK